MSTPRCATCNLAGFAPATRTSSSALACESTTHRLARRSASRVAARKKGAFVRVCSAGSVKKVASCNVTTVGSRISAGIV